MCSVEQSLTRPLSPPPLLLLTHHHHRHQCVSSAWYIDIFRTVLYNFLVSQNSPSSFSVQLIFSINITVVFDIVHHLEFFRYKFWETGHAVEVFCWKETKTIDSVQNNNFVFCNTPLPRIFRFMSELPNIWSIKYWMCHLLCHYTLQ